MIQAKLDQLANLLIRPRRRSYPESDLGPTHFKSKSSGYCVRKDFQVAFKYGSTYGYSHDQNTSQNEEGPTPIMINVSIFYPSICQGTLDQVCVVGMHGNTGSKMSTLSLLEPVLSLGMIFAVFDFAGCGNSEGEFVTLGYYQKHQIAAVLDHIHRKYGWHRFLLYGRSMGAASALFYSTHVYPRYVSEKNAKLLHYYQSLIQSNSESPHSLFLKVLRKFKSGLFGYEVIGMILDSPYYDTKELFMGAVGRRLWFLPSSLISYLLNSVEARALEKLKNVGMRSMNESPEGKEQKQRDIKQASAIFSLVNDIKIPTDPHIAFPTLILYGLHDDVITQNHIWELFKKLHCQNKKLHVIEDQGHGGHREDSLKTKLMEWVLELELEKILRKSMRNASILGITVEEYLNYQLENESVQGDEIVCMNKEKEKERNKVLEVISEKTLSLTTLQTGQARHQFGSMTSLQDNSDWPNKRICRANQIESKSEKKSFQIGSMEKVQKLLVQMQIIELQKIGNKSGGHMSQQEMPLNSCKMMKQSQ